MKPVDMVGYCDKVVDALLEAGGPGKRKDGVWTGKAETPRGFKERRGLKKQWRTDAKGHVVHTWVEMPDGSIIDPTRWVFEGSWPYTYRGVADFYDEAALPLEATW